MGHTLPISHHYYQATVSTGDAIDTFNRISKMATKEDPAADRETKKIRRSWRPSEVDNIKSYFSLAIKSGHSITLQQAREFLHHHPIPDRTPKDIQDKVATIKRKSAKT
jgi:hypothetical protein